MPDAVQPTITERLMQLWRQTIAVIASLVPAVVAWDYGGVLPWTKWALALTTFTLLVASLPLLLVRRPSSRLVYGLPLLALLIWGYTAFQTVPLPKSIVSVLSPASASAYELWDNVRGEPSAVAIPISVAPWYTRNYLFLPACFAGFVLIGTVVLRGEKSPLILLTLSLLAGVAISYLGIADKVNVHQMRGDLLAPTGSGLPFGPFVNRNNAAGFLNLCLACGIGTLVYRHRVRLKERKNDDRYRVSGNSRWEKIVSRITLFGRLTDNLSVVIVALSIVIASGIFISGSRGGMLACLAGTLVIGFRSVNRSRKFTALIAISIGFVGFGLALGSIGMIASVQERFAQTWGDDALQDGRLNHWQDSLVASANYLPCGAGLGTYRFAYTPFQHHGAPSWFVNADGMPFEWLLEGGLIMIGLVIAAVAWTYRLLWNLAFYKNTPTDAAIATTAWFAIPSLLVSQAFDFGILLPANTLLTALILSAVCASVKPVIKPKRRPKGGESVKSRSSTDAKAAESTPTISTAYPELQTKASKHSLQTTYHRSRSKGSRKGSGQPGSVSEGSAGGNAGRRPKVPRKSGRRRAIDLTLAITCWFGCLVTTGLAIPQQFEAAQTDRLVRQLKAWRPELVDANTKIDSIVNDVQEALQRYPDNPDLQLADAQAMLLQSRAAALAAGPSAADHTEFVQQWQLTEPALQRHRFHTIRTASPGDPIDWHTVLLAEQSPSVLTEARDRVIATLRRCPLNDSAATMLVTLDFVEHGFEHSERWLKHLHRLGIRRPDALQHLGVLAAVHPGPELALKMWREELQLAPQRLAGVWRTIEQLEIEADLNAIVPDDPAALLLAAQSLTKDPAVREQLLSRIDEIIRREGRTSLKQIDSSLEPDESETVDERPLRRAVADDSQWHYFNAGVAMLRGDFVAAENAYRDAVQMSPGNIVWREQFANLLLRNGKQKEAIAQIERCILQAPDNRRFQKLASQFRAAEVTAESSPITDQ